MAPDEGATGPSCGWTEGITLPLLQRMETEEKKAEDEGKKVHRCPCKRLRTGGDRTRGNGRLQGHPSWPRARLHGSAEIHYTTLCKTQDHTGKM